MRDVSPPRKPSQPRDYFETLRAPSRPLTGNEKAILRAETARRYAWHDKQRREASTLRFITLLRLNDLERLFADRYDGLYLPDDDSGWDDLTIVAHHLAHFGGTTSRVVARIVEWAAMWAPAFPTDKVTECATEVAANPMKWTADKLAWRLGLTMVTRTKLKITTIGAVDVKRKDRPAWLREYHRRAKEEKRRDHGFRPLKEYLARSIEAAKPWEDDGISRRTWWRRRKQKLRGTSPADQPKQPGGTGPADQRSKIRSAGLVPPTSGAGGSPTAAGLADHGVRGQSRATSKGTTTRRAKQERPAKAKCRSKGNTDSPSPAPRFDHWVVVLPHLVRTDGFGRVPVDRRWRCPCATLLRR